MTRQSVWLWLCVLALTLAACTLVAMAPTSTPQGSIVYMQTRAGPCCQTSCIERLHLPCSGAAGIPASKETSGLVRTDGKQPDGCTLIPWCSGKALTWDVTVACTVADSYIQDSSRTPGAVAKLAASTKRGQVLHASWHSYIPAASI